MRALNRLVENSAIENMLVNGKKLIKAQMKRTMIPVVGITSFARGACMSAKFMSMAILIIVANVCGLLVSLR